jgi:hypothetical protein
LEFVKLCFATEKDVPIFWNPGEYLPTQPPQIPQRVLQCLPVTLLFITALPRPPHLGTRSKCAWKKERSSAGAHGKGPEASKVARVIAQVGICVKGRAWG